MGPPRSRCVISHVASASDPLARSPCGRLAWRASSWPASYWALRWLLNRFREEDYSALLRSLNTRVHAVLQRCNRDAIAGGCWGLVAGQPRLLLVAARATLPRPDLAGPTKLAPAADA